MPVIVRQPLPGIAKLLRFPRRMRIIETHDPGAMRIVQRERITQPVRDIPARFHGPRPDLHPVAVALVENLSVQLEERA